MRRKQLTVAEVRERIGGIDTLSVRHGVFTARRGFFYTHGQTADLIVLHIKAGWPDAIILESGEIWKPFVGGAPTARQSHWFVTFTFAAAVQR